MIPGPDAQRIKLTLRILWVIWAAELVFLIALYLMFGSDASVPANLFANLIGFVPLFVSIIIRWLVMPRSGARPGRLLVIFVAGVALAESCGVMGIFLGGPYRQDLFILGLLGVAQFVPLFARQALEPKPEGFIPNN